MKRILLATVASLALSLPAMAAQNTMQPQNQTQPQQSQMNNQQQSGTSQYGSNQQSNKQAMNGQQRIMPSQLNKRQITRIQQALNKKGFDAKHTDGIWGPETDAALQNFQQKNNLPGSGHLNRQTLSALGVNVTPQTRRGTSGTVGAGPSNGGSMNSSQMNSNQNNMGANGAGSQNENSGKAGADSMSGQSGSNQPNTTSTPQ